MSEKLSPSYWIIAVGDESGKQKFEAFDYRGKYKNLCEAFKYRVPNLKIGTIDSLIALSDELSKSDGMLSNLSKKIKRVFDDTVKQEPGKMSSAQINLLRQISDENYQIEDDTSSVTPTLVIGDHDNAKTPRQYLENFQWNKHLYNELDSIEKFKEKILSEFAATDDELRRFSSEFSDIKAQVVAHERKLNGSLLVRPISKYIDPTQHIVETNHLTTILIAVPRNKQQEFLDSYMQIESLAKARIAAEKARHAEMDAKIKDDAKLRDAAKAKEVSVSTKAASAAPLINDTDGSDDTAPATTKPETKEEKVIEKVEPKPSNAIVTPTVVPGSALKVIGENELPDDEFVLFRVVLFKRDDINTVTVGNTEKSSDRSAENVEFYKGLCREQRWTIRPFKYDKDEEKHNNVVMADLVNRRRTAWRYLLVWCESKFDSVYTAWMHCIAARVFVESILRYGVRATTSALIVRPLKNQEKKLRDVLERIFGAEVSKKEKESGEIDMASFGGSAQEYFPYVNVTIDFGDL